MLHGDEECVAADGVRNRNADSICDMAGFSTRSRQIVVLETIATERLPGGGDVMGNRFRCRSGVTTGCDQGDMN